ncbi:MAG: tetratricopeptide repeat protein [Deltaproteobacteria bacterium]|nr:tetratricopeptide repeat protein [Deltaproteobacteria bacterium]
MTRQGNPRKKKKAVGVRQARSSPDHRAVREAVSVSESAAQQGAPQGAQQGAQQGAPQEAQQGWQPVDGEDRHAASPLIAGSTLGPPPSGVAYELALDTQGHEGELQDLFFQRGLDEAHLAAHHADHDHFKSPPRWNRLAIGIGAVGLLGVVVLASLSTGKTKKHRVESPPVAAAVARPEAHAAPPPKAPEPVEKPMAAASVDAGSEPPELKPTTTTPPTVLTEAAFSPFVLDEATALACKKAYKTQKYGEVVKLCGAIIDGDATPAVTPETVELTSFVAHAFLLTNKLNEAAATAEKIIAVAPDHAFAHVVLGMAEQERGHAKDARRAYTRYLELEPKGTYAADLRAVLRGL